MKKSTTENMMYFGAAYYPEVWSAEAISHDISMMQKAGMNVMRMAEFAWAKMEPEEGVYDFKWLHDAVSLLADARIHSVLGTPSTTPPIWLTKKFQEILFVDDNGRPRQHGERCHWCPNQPIYREYVAKIVKKMAMEFGKDPRVIAWQIDNEPYPSRRGCCCHVCVAKFREHLKSKFNTIENLNTVWGLDLWSQRYSCFDDIEAPRSDIWHHPSMITEWMRFQSDSYADFVNKQVEILRHFTDRPIGTDMMPLHRLNYRDVAACTDIMMLNHYPREGDLRNSQFWMSYMSAFKDQPFWVTESSVSNTSATAVAKENGHRSEGFVRALSWIPVMLGGQANLYWLWRCHRSGQELTHGSVLDSAGRPTCGFDEVAEIGQGFNKAKDFVTQTRPEKAKVALHFSCDTALMFEYQPLANKFQYEDFYRQRGPHTGELNEIFFKPLIEAQYAVDVIDPSISLEGYVVVLSPMQLSLNESNLRERLKTWIQNGGTWVVGPMTDIRTEHCTKHIDSPFSVLEEWTGARCRWQIIGNTESPIFNIKFKSGLITGGRVWYDVFDVPKNAEILGTYENDRLKDQTAAFSVSFGKGKIVVLGSVPSDNGILCLLKPLFDQNGIKPLAQATKNLLLVHRTGDSIRGIMVAEVNGHVGEIVLKKAMTDIITGQCYGSGSYSVKPYQILILQ